MLALIVLIAAGASIGWRIQKVRADNEALHRIAVERANRESGLREAQEKVAAAARDESALASALAQARRALAASASDASEQPTASLGPDVSLLMERDPELRALFLRNFRANLALRFQIFYEVAGLSAGQIEKFEALMAEAEQDRIDLDSTARAQGMDKSSPEYARLRRELSARHAQEQRALLGEQGLQRLQKYSRLVPLIAFMNNVSTAVSQTSEPLTMDRAKNLLEIMASADKSFKKGERADPAAIKWDEALPKAEKILTPAQFEALKVHSNLAHISHLLKEYDARQKQK